MSSESSSLNVKSVIEYHGEYSKTRCGYCKNSSSSFLFVDFNRFRGAFPNRFRLRKMHQQRVETKREVGVPSDADREQLLRAVHDSIERGTVSKDVETEESGEKV